MLVYRSLITYFDRVTGGRTSYYYVILEGIMVIMQLLRFTNTYSHLYAEQLFFQIAEDLIRDKVVTVTGNLFYVTIFNIPIALMISIIFTA